MMKWFLFLAAFLPITPTMAEVVNSVSNCSEFLLEGSPPQIPGIIENGVIKDQNRYKLICQTFNNKRRFLTVYDTTNKIPVFSAYKFKKITAEERPNIPWMIKSQLSGDAEINMKNYKPTKDDKQATDGCYKQNNQGYDRGHLYPVFHGPEVDDKKSTYTLTNVVPQAKNFNRGRWRVMEARVKNLMEKYCINNSVIEGFVVVGALPSADKFLLRGKVNIPDKLWSAFCCYSSTKNKWLAGAHWDKNTNESEGCLPIKRGELSSVRELNQELNKELKTTSVNVFPGQNECLNNDELVKTFGKRPKEIKKEENKGGKRRKIGR
ncbi:endonuclease domain-containing 1 protein-like [Melanotaenia boesemani]|uniref:endonuclease domain-containing 1 protein-like n=1 Tax=Melanotaenia boesemani TaxID=1250792 RepID=UPI001C04C933|nr:endonuclease domain-containing 1 protein-like [Melanotaenia boesemani]